MSDFGDLDESSPGMIERLQAAQLSIDYVFGKGFAVEHPEMVGIAALTCSMDDLIIGSLYQRSGAIVALGIDSSIQLPTVNNEYWRVSQLAANDKAKELGITIKPEWDINDLRYKIDRALRGVVDE